MEVYEWCCVVVVLLLVTTALASSAGAEHPQPHYQQQQQRAPASCPAQCVCNAAAKTATCAAASLTRVPSGLSPDLISLDLSQNRISQISAADFRSLNTTQDLDLQGIGLTTISTDAFRGQSSQQTPALESNHVDGGDDDDDFDGDDDDQLGFFHQFFPMLQYLDLSDNDLAEFDVGLLTNLTQLKVLNLSGNSLEEFAVEPLSTLPRLAVLDLSSNNLTNLSLSSEFEGTLLPCESLESLFLGRNKLMAVDALSRMQLTGLLQLDLSDNALEVLHPDWFSNMPNLTYLSIANNQVADIPAGAFSQCSHLQQLEASDLHNLTYIHRDSLAGLHSLQTLNLSRTSSLSFVHPYALQSLHELRRLDLSGSALTSLHELTFQNLTSLQNVGLYHIPWSCDCELKWLRAWLASNETQILFPHINNILCSKPPTLEGASLLSVPETNFSCSAPTITHQTQLASFRIGSAAVLDCVVEGTPNPEVTWITPDNIKLRFRPAFVDLSAVQPHQAHFHSSHYWHDTNVYLYEHSHEKRVQVLQNGSLYIDYVMRTDGGPYVCLAENYLGNDTIAVQFRLDYRIIQLVSERSIWIGFSCAGVFFLVTMVVSASRYIAFVCSQKERQKRKSIREVLDRMTMYKSAQIDKLSAYKTAKIDQFSAKMDQFSAFKSAKIDKIRTHKQMTVASALHHMERLREIYSNQMNKIKENSSQQVEKLRENYTTQLGKFQNYRSHQIDKIRENYNNQLLKVREYGSTHIEKLREQYKLQQLHVLKLMELLDVGNCMTAIEAECMRTESMLFDPAMTFDLEAQPVHIGRGSISDSDDVYVTAGSNSESCSVTGVQVEVNTENETNETPLNEHAKRAPQNYPPPPQDSCSEDGSPAPKPKHKRPKNHRKGTYSKNCKPDSPYDEEMEMEREDSRPPEKINETNDQTRAQLTEASSDVSSCYVSAQQSHNNSPETDEIKKPPSLSLTQPAEVADAQESAEESIV